MFHARHDREICRLVDVSSHGCQLKNHTAVVLLDVERLDATQRALSTARAKAGQSFNEVLMHVDMSEQILIIITIVAGHCLDMRLLIEGASGGKL